MFTVSCDHCGAQHKLDESRVPPSGMVMKCPKCTKPMTVMPGAGGIGEELDLDTVAPVPRGESKHAGKRPIGGPALAQFDASAEPALDDDGLDLLAPKGGAKGLDLLDLPSHKDEDIVDLPAPKGAFSSRANSSAEVPDLLAPVGPNPTRGGGGGGGIALAGDHDDMDLLAPVGPSPTRSDRGEIPDLLAPVGPGPMRAGRSDIPDLLAPVGPTPSKNAPDLLAPVGPTSARGVPDLLTPVGSRSTRNAPDLLSPVGPTSAQNVDLLAPVGPTSRAAPDLLTPVGSLPKKNAPDLLTPVGPTPSKGGGGFFEDAPAAPSLDLDSLDLAPPSPAKGSGGAPPSLDLGGGGGGGGGGGTPPPFALDSLDLAAPAPARSSPDAPPSDTGINYGEVDLNQPPDDSAPGVVSFNKPGAAKPASISSRPSARPSGDSLDIADAPKKKAGTTAEDPDAVITDRPGAGTGKPGKATKVKAEKRAKTPAELKRQKIILAAVGAVVLLGAGGLFLKTRMDAKAQRIATMKNALVKARKAMLSDEVGHWDQATAAANQALKIDEKNADALGLAAQARFASFQDEGLARDQRIGEGNGFLQRAVKAGAGKATELEKALALKVLVLDEKPEAAVKALQTLQAKTRDGDVLLYLGWAQLENKEPTAAKTTFEAALQTVPERLPALYGLARAQFLLGETDEQKGARATLKRIEKKNPTHLGMRVLLAEMKPSERDWKKRDLLIEIVASPEAKGPAADPRIVAHAAVLAGDEYMISGPASEALRLYKQAAALDQNNLEAQLGIGVAMLAQTQLEDAKVQFESVTRRDQRSLKAWLGLGRVALKQGDVVGARKAVDQAALIASDNAEVQFWIGQVAELEPEPEGPKAAEAAYRKAIGLDDKRLEPRVALARLLLRRAEARDTAPTDKEKLGQEAIVILEPAEGAAKTDSYLSNQLGVAYLNAHNVPRAKEKFLQALALDPNNLDAQANLGDALAAETPPDMVAALAAYKKAYDEDGGKREDIALRLGAAYEKVRDFAAAEAVHDKLLAAKTPSPTVRAAAGRYYARHGKLDKAIAEGERLHAEDPDNAAGMFLRGIAHMAKKDKTGRAMPEWTAAQKVLDEATRADPQAQYYEGLGRAYEGLRSWEDALRAHAKAIELDRSYPAPLIGRARIRNQARQYTLALDDLREAQTLDPDDALVYMMIGYSLFGSGKYREAVAPYQTAIEKDPELAEAYFRLAMDYRELGNRGGDVIVNLEAALARATGAKIDERWVTEAYYVLGQTYFKADRRKEMCEMFDEFLRRAEPDAAERRDVESIRKTRCAR